MSNILIRYAITCGIMLCLAVVLTWVGLPRWESAAVVVFGGATCDFVIATLARKRLQQVAAKGAVEMQCEKDGD